MFHDQQRIMFKGSKLDDGRTIAELNTQHDSTLHIVYRDK